MTNAIEMCDECGQEDCLCDKDNLDDVLAGKEEKQLILDTCIYDTKNNIIFSGHNVLGVIVKHKNKNIIILNADFGETYQLVLDCENKGFPTVSFACLSRFYVNTNHDSNNNILDIAKKITSGKLRLVDYNPEDYKQVSNEQNKKYYKWIKDKIDVGPNPIKCPAGYSILDDGYHIKLHKPSSCLFRENLKSGSSFLLGMDENQYFGCELPIHPKNMQEAFTCLIPKDIRKKEYYRQGEWFIIETSKMPQLHELNLIACSFDLPVDDINSNSHCVSCAYGGIKDNIIYAQNPTIEHPEHQALNLHGNYYFVKNTAVRSVSQDGVD